MNSLFSHRNGRDKMYLWNTPRDVSCGCPTRLKPILSNNARAGMFVFGQLVTIALRLLWCRTISWTARMIICFPYPFLLCLFNVHHLSSKAKTEPASCTTLHRVYDIGASPMNEIKCLEDVSTLSNSASSFTLNSFTNTCCLIIVANDHNLFRLFGGVLELSNIL